MLADRSVRAVVLIAFVLMLGNGIVLPILPLFARSFGVGYGAAGLLIAAYGIARIGCDLGAGLVVDRVGERGAGAAGLAAVDGVRGTHGARAEPSRAAVVFWGAVGASSARRADGELRVSAARRAGCADGAHHGHLLRELQRRPGGRWFRRRLPRRPLRAREPALRRRGPRTRSPAALYLLFVPRLAHAGEAGERHAGEAALEAVGVARTPGLTAAAHGPARLLWMFAAVFGTLLALFGRDELGMSAAAIGIVFAVGLVVELVVLYPAGSIADRHGRKVVLVPALVGLAALTALIGLAGARSCSGSSSPAWRSHQGSGAWLPARCSRTSPPRAELGTAAGVFRLFGDVGFALGPLVAGWWPRRPGCTEAFLVSAVPAVVALALVVRTPETLHAGSAGVRAQCSGRTLGGRNRLAPVEPPGLAVLEAAARPSPCGTEAGSIATISARPRQMPP